MSSTRFLRTRPPHWERLEELLRRTSTKGVSALTERELHEVTRLYPAVAVDAARARALKIGPKTQERINNLAIAAHGLLYRRKPVRSGSLLWRFFWRGYPRLFRRLWPYLALSFLLLAVGSTGAYVTTRLRPPNAYLFVPGELDLTDAEPGVSAKDISERFRRIPNAPMASLITTNNISVALKAFALGITAGIGTCVILFYNAMMLGGFVGHFANHGLQFELWSFIAPHGVLEIFAILVAGAAGLRLGFSPILPGRRTRKASLRAGAEEAVLLVLGTIPMFIVAGLIEGFVTPSYLPGAMKITLGIAVWLATMAYLLMAGRRNESEERGMGRKTDGLTTYSDPRYSS